jgi:alpha-ribazole phosphatase
VNTAALWVVRHAAPCIAPGTCYGLLDVPADPEATQIAAQRLATSLPNHLLLRHSPLQRCEQLALSLCALQVNLISNADVRLREMDFGQWEGRLWADIARHELDAWTQDFTRYRPGQGEDLACMLTRVSAALDEARQHLQRGTHVVWITHAGVARCVDWLVRQGSLAAALQVTAEQWPLHAPGFGGWQTYAMAPHGVLAALQQAQQV